MVELPSRPLQLEPMPCCAALSLVLRVVAEVDEGVVTLRRLHDDVAAAAAIATGRAASGHKLLASEGHAAVTAVAGLHSDFSFVDEHGKPGNRCQGSGIRPIRRGLQACSSPNASFSVYRTEPKLFE